MPLYNVGQQVRYKAIGGPDSNTPSTVGTIMTVITEPSRMTGHNVQASEEDPRYEIKNDHTGKKSAIFETNILGPAA
ncbi:hypothetical protein GTA08_BOTSDO01555 [Neofusicoccum parvum]|uniref:Hypervirulence associated protein TUDOR domain-containing protein n=3 Tax=Neofusicoccum TaxID=407951 RepID=R1EXD9_BOTPV|nr:hypothetical protein UCRNP2_916 [Neofusicoccum parvum UCRNP2]GME26297.1 hypothetical protein GTA08_BOTSDO01555 [Neofusicoccum parvum]GME48073.1 hypothetical protein GTA08_BOTSDO01555 [Neofusicoccum parvum]